MWTHKYSNGTQINANFTISNLTSTEELLMYKVVEGVTTLLTPNFRRNLMPLNRGLPANTLTYEVTGADSLLALYKPNSVVSSKTFISSQLFPVTSPPPPETPESKPEPNVAETPSSPPAPPKVTDPGTNKEPGRTDPFYEREWQGVSIKYLILAVVLITGVILGLVLCKFFGC
mmetsp:Transcript_19083/g.21977  ORF Transcript_19083/g.21977 Transcript_19083/m.21977 type:complete len:174 (+) Transcript_19083:616-1137(+)